MVGLFGKKLNVSRKNQILAFIHLFGAIGFVYQSGLWFIQGKLGALETAFTMAIGLFFFLIVYRLVDKDGPILAEK